MFLLVILLISMNGCSIQQNLKRDFKGNSREELMGKMGEPTRVEKLTNGRTVSIYEKYKVLKAAPINTGAFQYDKFESPRSIKNERYMFYFNAEGVVEDVNYSVSYDR